MYYVKSVTGLLKCYLFVPLRVEIKSFIIPGKTLNFLIKLCSYCQNILRKSFTPPKVKILRICTLLFFQHFSEFTDQNTQGKNKSYISLHIKMKFSIKDFFSKCDQIRSFLFPADLVTFTEEILNEMLLSLYNVSKYYKLQ